MHRREVPKLLLASAGAAVGVVRSRGTQASSSHGLTRAEAAAGVTPVNFAFPPGQVDRYFENRVPGISDATIGFRRAVAQAQQLDENRIAIGAPVTVSTHLAIAGAVTIPAATGGDTPTAPVLLQIVGGSIAIAASGSLTIGGTFSAPRTTVFTKPESAGPVVFQSGSVGEAYPEWWGARADAHVDAAIGTDSTSALRAALLACAGGASLNIGVVPIKLAAGYYMTGPQILPPATVLLGPGREQCGFAASPGTSGTWFTDRSTGSSRGAAKIIIEGVAFYCNRTLAPAMTNGLVLGYNGAFGTEGYLRGVWVRDCACAGGGWHLDVLGNVAFFDMVCVQGNNAPNQNLMRLSGGGGGNMLRSIDLVAAGPECSSLHQGSPSCMISGLEIEAPGSRSTPSTAVPPLYLGANTDIHGLLLSGADDFVQDAWIEFGPSATTVAITGLTYVFHTKRTAIVTNGNMKRADGSYFGGNATGGGSPWRSGARYLAGDMVNSQDIVYLCERANSDIKPPDADHWRILVCNWAPHGGEGNYFSETGFLKPQAFHLRLANNGPHGLQHRISDAAGNAANLANLISGSRSIFSTTASSALADDATPFAYGAKISSERPNTIVLATPGWPWRAGMNTQRPSDANLMCTIAVNKTRIAALSVAASFQRFDIGGIERNYLNFAFFEAGTAFPLTTANIGTGDFIDVAFSGYLSP